MCRVGQYRLYTPYTAVYLLISLPRKTFVHRVYMAMANPTYMTTLIIVETLFGLDLCV
jgi:hypothetical protein